VPLDLKRIYRVLDGRQVKGLRAAVLIAALFQALLFVALVVYIDRNANPRGDGLEWIAAVPAFFIVVIFVAPAFLFGAINRLLTLGALFAGVGAIVSLVFYFEIVQEFATSGSR
jgi:hypothetical protein